MTRVEQARDRRRDELNAELARIVSVASALPGVVKILVFGSVARGDVGPASDLDLVIVLDTDKCFIERLGEMYRMLTPRVELDLLVYTPEEFDRLRHERSFVRRLAEEARVVYAAAA
jgi:predicted nucleotidyltransferase